jgi:hypothetical protein
MPRTPGKKRVAKKRLDRSHSFWHDLCRKYVQGKYSSCNAFLRSADSGSDVSIHDARTFQRALLKFKEGSLKNDDKKRKKASPYEDIRAKLIEYIELRERLYKRDKCGLSWALLKEKALIFGEQLGHGGTFKAGDSFIQGALQAANKKGVFLHGEGMEMTLEEQIVNKHCFIVGMREKMEEYNISLDRVYNADQTGLFFNKLPNRMYINCNEKHYRGVKQMKSKDRVTLMVASSAAGAKIPLFMVGKSKQPECFRLLAGGKPPMHYHHQPNAWFDREVTLVWINTVLWPWHLQQFGDVHCLLLLDNCPAHSNLDESKLPRKLIIYFFPPNCTSFLQPADQGMIACLKVGYKANMLKKLLAVCDDSVLYDEAIAAGARARRGCKGLEYCGKAHLLDAMEILQPIWTTDDKYAKKESIQRCWRKAGLLTASEEADLENEIGRRTVPLKAKVISDDECAELCSLFSTLQTKISSFKELPPALRGSIIEERACSMDELANICHNWVDIEDDEDVINDDVEEAMEYLTSANLLPSFDNFALDNFDDYDALCSVGTVDCQLDKTHTWNDCLKACEVVREFLAQKLMGSELVAFEAFTHKLRVKRIDAVSCQLSIKSFFNKK